MSEKKLSKEQLGILKKIINDEEGKSAKEGSDEQNVKNTDNFEAFGRAIIEQIANESAKEAHKDGGSANEMVLDTQITVDFEKSDSSAKSEDLEWKWLTDAAKDAAKKVGGAAGDVTGKVGGAAGDIAGGLVGSVVGGPAGGVVGGVVGGAVTDFLKDKRACVTVAGQKICIRA